MTREELKGPLGARKLKEILLKKEVLLSQKRTLLEQYEEDVIRLTADLRGLEEAQAFFQKGAQELQARLKFRLEGVVNQALMAVFPNQYSFGIEFKTRAGRSEADLRITDLLAGRSRHPMDSNGGGLSDIVGFCLRMAVIIIAKNRRILILDEAFKFVSPGMKEAAYEIMNVLVRRLGFQVLANTHDVAQMREISDREFRFERIEQEVGDAGVFGVTRVRVMGTTQVVGGI